MSDTAPETISFNVNSYVRVRLTDFGRLHLRKLWPKCFSTVEESDGWSRWWFLMEMFGEVIGNGRDLPFETTIQIERQH